MIECLCVYVAKKIEAQILNFLIHEPQCDHDHDGPTKTGYGPLPMHKRDWTNFWHYIDRWFGKVQMWFT
jgi:hypothetical protein